MAAIFQTTFSDAFSWTKMYIFWLRFHWSLFPRVQLTIFQHWFRYAHRIIVEHPVSFTKRQTLIYGKKEQINLHFTDTYMYTHLHNTHLQWLIHVIHTLSHTLRTICWINATRSTFQFSSWYMLLDLPENEILANDIPDIYHMAVLSGQSRGWYVCEWYFLADSSWLQGVNHTA